MFRRRNSGSPPAAPSPPSLGQLILYGQIVNRHYSQAQLTASPCAVNQMVITSSLLLMNIPTDMSPLGGIKDELPTGYSPLEFLLTAGPQYINTGLSVTPLTGCKIELAPVKYSTEWSVSCGSMAGFIPLHNMKSCIGYGYATDVAVGNAKYLLKDGTYTNSAAEAIKTNLMYEMQGRAKVALNYLNSRVWQYRDTVNQIQDILIDSPTSATPIYLFARNYSKYSWVYWSAPIYKATFSEGKCLTRRFIPALTPSGRPCMFDLISRQPFLNSGSGEFTAGLKLKQVRALSNLPTGGGTLTISLPSGWESNETTNACLNSAQTKGWTLIVQTHQEPKTAISTYSLRRKQAIVWCCKAACDIGIYVDTHGNRYQIEWCSAIFSPKGNAPELHGYEPFHSIEEAAETWQLHPYVSAENEASE